MNEFEAYVKKAPEASKEKETKEQPKQEEEKEEWMKEMEEEQERQNDLANKNNTEEGLVDPSIESDYYMEPGTKKDVD